LVEEFFESEGDYNGHLLFIIFGIESEAQWIRCSLARLTENTTIGTRVPIIGHLAIISMATLCAMTRHKH